MFLDGKQSDSSLLDDLETYSNSHGIDLTKTEQPYYNYASNEPITGFNPYVDWGYLSMPRCRGKCTTRQKVQAITVLARDYSAYIPNLAGEVYVTDARVKGLGGQVGHYAR